LLTSNLAMSIMIKVLLLNIQRRAEEASPARFRSTVGLTGGEGGAGENHGVMPHP
jgi:hypothetical protein